MLRFAFFLVATLSVWAAEPDAERLFQQTDYNGALRVLEASNDRSPRTWWWIGRNYFALGDFKKAVDAFEKAVQGDPQRSEYVHWLGRGWGRRAELANPIFAAGYASKTRQFFERAVALDPHNKEALSDLFEYYLEAPGILGGGLNRAEAVAAKISAVDEAEGHYMRAQLADRRKDYDGALQQLLRAAELAPKQLGRTLDVAKYLSKMGRVQESEAAFAKAEKVAPNSPRILFARAETYIRDHRNLPLARTLLQQYLGARLTASDPPRAKAEELLRKAG